jgi:hypothetical protein
MRAHALAHTHARTHTHARAPARTHAHTHAHARTRTCTHTGDALFTWTVYENQQKPWVAQLVTPYLVVFGFAALVSLFTLVRKGRLLFAKLRSRQQLAQRDVSGVELDTKWRQEWIATMTSQQQVYTESESLVIARAVQLLDGFAVGPGLSRTKFDAQSQRLVGATTCTIPGARPDQVAAYLMHADSHAVRSNLDPNVVARFELIERANSHQGVTFVEMKTAPFQNRTFLNVLVCQKVSNNVWVWATVPLSSHARIDPQDEKHAVRGEGIRCFRLTATPEGETLVEYVCSLDLKGSFPTWFANQVAVPQLMRHAASNAARCHAQHSHRAAVTCGLRNRMPIEIQGYFRRMDDAETACRLDENHLELRKLCVLAPSLRCVVRVRLCTRASVHAHVNVRVCVHACMWVRRARRACECSPTLSRA